ncbi:MAG: thioredoxin domain-containing protein [Myxococcales bacterium]|nr:thioredoxin domain-containing protein [Myxococcales bacterium]
MRFLLALLLLVPAPALAQPLNPLPGVDTKGLQPAELTALTELMNQGACPCTPKDSLLACIQQKSCPEATALADFGAAKFRDGLGAEQVQEAVVRKYLMDHTPTATFELGDTPFKGDPNAAITIVEFADFECPHCAHMAEVMRDFVKKNKGLKLYFKQFPLGMHPQSEKAAVATLAAHRQGKFWPMHDLCFQNQGKLSDDSYAKFAGELGLNVTKFQADMADPALAQQVARDRQEAIAAGLQGTPTLYFNGRQYMEEKTAEALQDYLKRLRKKLAAEKK